MAGFQTFNRCVFLLLVVFVFSDFAIAETSFSFADIEKLPPFSQSVKKLSSQEKIKWLREKIASSPDPKNFYRYNTALIGELFFNAKRSEAASLCRSLSVLKNDFTTRAVCVELLYPNAKDYILNITRIIEDAKAINNNDMAGQLLARRAWRKSEAGDIAGAFLDYDVALRTASPSNAELISAITFDTASSYIVHGNEFYIKKGIELLKDLRNSKVLELKKEIPQERRDYLKLEIQVSYFNTGIANMLHLHNYEEALIAFEKASKLDNSLSISAITYSAFVAAKLGYHEKAKNMLSMVEGRKTQRSDVDSYLPCYQQLAKQYWTPDLKPMACLRLHEDTALEDRLDIYKRLTDNVDQEIALFGLKQLKSLFVNELEPKLRNSGTQSATSTEVTRLEKESELKSLVLSQQKQLQSEVAEKHAKEKQFFIALFLFLIFFILFFVSQLRQKKKLAEQFQKMSIMDPLTKLGNRRFLEQQIDRELAFVQRAILNKQPNTLGIFIFDVDHFKKVNDNYGHTAGDEVLVEMSKRINSIVRDCDLLIRWGGEEFLFVARMTSKKEKYELADRLLKAVNSSPFVVSDGALTLKVTCTIGVVEFPFVSFNLADVWPRLISIADAALYFGKSKGRNCWISVSNESVSNEEQLQTVTSQSLEQSINERQVSVKTSLDAGA